MHCDLFLIYIDNNGHVWVGDIKSMDMCEGYKTNGHVWGITSMDMCGGYKINGHVWGYKVNGHMWGI